MEIGKIVRAIARVFLGIVFVFSGYMKIIDPMGSAIKFGEYFEALSLQFLEPAALELGIFMAVAEISIGICYLLGINMRLASLAGVLFMLFFTPLTLWLAVTDAVKDCGCFGDAVTLSNWETFYKNLVLLPIAIFIFIVRKKYKPLFSCAGEFIMGVIIALICTGISIYSYRHLPLIDFMAYRVGVNILDDMEMKEGAEQDVYEHTFIYEKDGKKETFDIESLPDSTWTFVSTNPKLIKEGYTPPTRDFIISNEEGDYVHDELLSEEGYLMFLTSPKIQNISYKKKDEISALKKYVESKGIKFIAISGSTNDQNKVYSENIGEDYPIYYSDETVVKSMVRSNPGLMLLKDGTIISKWSYLDTPKSDEIDRLLSENPTQIIEANKRGENYGKIIAIAVLGIFFLLFSYAHIRREKTEYA